MAMKTLTFRTDKKTDPIEVGKNVTKRSFDETPIVTKCFNCPGIQCIAACHGPVEVLPPSRGDSI
jgi:hypothetical protein